MHAEKCLVCNGRGQLDDGAECARCLASGWVPVQDGRPWPVTGRDEWWRDWWMVEKELRGL
ncbi:MAG: hypothetical protein ABIL09_16130 [Gemmatimonadota bacterium]